MGRWWTGYTSIAGDRACIFHSHGVLWRFASPCCRQSSHGYGLFEATIPSEKMRWIHSLRGAECELTETLGVDEEAPDNLLEGRFVCMRRASDISQEKSFIAAPEAGKHKDPKFGTHHAYDAWRLFNTRGLDLNLFSSAIKLNTQYMHSIWFRL